MNCYVYIAICGNVKKLHGVDVFRVWPAGSENGRGRLQQGKGGRKENRVGTCVANKETCNRDRIQ